LGGIIYDEEVISKGLYLKWISPLGTTKNLYFEADVAI